MGFFVGFFSFFFDQGKRHWRSVMQIGSYKYSLKDL